MERTTTKVFVETLDIIRKLQALRVLHDLESETIPALIHRLVTVEFELASDNSDFSAATYQLGKRIMDNTPDDAWVKGEEFESRTREVTLVG